MEEEEREQRRLKQAVMIILSTCLNDDERMAHVQSSALELLVFMTGEYLKRLTDTLHRVVEIHRHSASPGINEVSMMLLMQKIHLGQLDTEMERTSHAVDSGVLVHINNNSNNTNTTPSSPPAKPQPSSKRLPSYMPSWLPSLPADHTYIHTPDYPNRTTQPKDIREELVKESLSAANALKSLSKSLDRARESLHNNNSNNNNNNTRRGSENDEASSPIQSSRHHHHNLIDVTSLDSDQKFDIVGLAKRKHKVNNNTTNTAINSGKRKNRHRINGTSAKVLLERHYKMALLGLEPHHHHHHHHHHHS